MGPLFSFLFIAAKAGQGEFIFLSSRCKMQSSLPADLGKVAMACYLCIEQEMKNISVLHLVAFALNPQLTCVFCTGFAIKLYVIIV